MWVDSLLCEYREGRKQLKKRYETLDSEDIEQSELRKTLSGMIRDMTFVIEWLETGRMPGQIKGVTGNYPNKLTRRYRKELDYGISGYWDESLNAFITTNNYVDPYKEVEDKIDAEREQITKGDPLKGWIEHAKSKTSRR